MTSPAWDSLHQYAADDLNVGARPKFLCDQCNRGFQRVEHLKRHRRCHSPEYRPFFCGVCSKGFSRSDTLNRHRLIHDCSDSCAGLTPPNEECAKPQPNRACYACAKARAKCSKGEVCSRCLSRSIPCVYPSSRKRRRRPDDFPQDGPSTDEIEGETDASTMYSASPEALMRQETADSRFTGALERCSLSRQREEHFAKMPKLAPVPNDMGEFQAHLQSQNQNQNQEICAQTARMSLDAETFLAGGTVTGVPAVFSHQESRSRYLAPAHYIKLNPNRHGEIASFELCFGDELYGEDFNSPTNWETPNLEPDMAGMSPVSMDNGSFALLPESDYSIQQAMPFNQSNAPVGYFQKNMGGNQFCRAAARYEQQANSDLPYPVCAPQQAKCSGGGWGLQRRRTDPYIPQPFVEQGATRPIASGASYQ